jgi:glucose/arabinose dehydrogenase
MWRREKLRRGKRHKIPDMWSGLLAGVFTLVLLAQAVETRACREPQPAPSPSPAPAPTPSPAPGAEVFTTTDGVRFSVETVAASLDVPWAIAFAPDGRLFVTERPGRVRILNLATRTSTTAITLDDVFAQGEAGGLGLALDPAFADNRLVYLYYTARLASGGGVNRVVRYREVNGVLGERAVLIENVPAATIHDGGRLRFGPDGLLYATAGDAANTALSQDLASLAGKILRITRDGASPSSNPFGSPIYSYGHRNPQGIDWHPVTGDLWASEHGPIGNDEINVIDLGANYGWPRIEGSQQMTGMRTPITFYTPAVAPSGASFYRGSRFPGFANNLFVATLRGQHLLRLIPVGATRTLQSTGERLLDGRFGRIRDVISGPDGYLYFVTSNGLRGTNADDDRIVRIVPAS